MSPDPLSPKYKDFAKNDKEAEERFQDWEGHDPLREVPPALLNSADIHDYARVTGMIWPFDADTNKLKPASYEIDFCGQLDLIGPQGRRVEDINLQSSFSIPENSIAFITLKPKFRLPAYIAVRFNLRINLVHRGLLLGTGPLVDPGFAGQLLIPLHNLTSDPVSLRGSDGFIWVEFTKLSPHRSWNSQARVDSKPYSPFPIEKRHRSTLQYFKAASPEGIPAQSSIPVLFKDARDDAALARNKAEAAEQRANTAYENTRKLLNTIALGSAAAAIATIATIAIALHDLNSGMQSVIQDAQNNIDAANKTIDETRSEIYQLSQVQERHASEARAREDFLLGKIETLEKKLADQKTRAKK